MNISKKSVLIILAFFSVYIIWGSTYLLNKIAVAQLAPFFIGSIRFTTAGCLVFIICKIMGLSLKISKKQLLNCTIAGILFLAYGNGVFVWALKYVDTGFAALEASTQPLFVLLLMRLIDGKKMKKKSLIGVSLGIFGMYLLVSQRALITSDGSLLGIFMILTCVLGWSYASVFVSKADLPSNFFVSTAYQMVIAGIFLAFSSLLFNEPWISPLNWQSDVKWSMIFLVVFGSIVAFTAFNYLLKVVSTEKVSTSAYVNPVIAIFLGWYILDEKITLQTGLAALILLTGVYFITTRKKTKNKIIGN